MIITAATQPALAALMKPLMDGGFIEKNPDVMFFPDMYMGRANFYETIEAVKDRPGWNTITAVKNDALYEINADIISRSGPRLVDALEAIAKMVHPEIFGQL